MSIEKWCKMKKIIAILTILLYMFISVSSTLALDYSSISTNAKITKALDILISINRRDVVSILYGNNATKRPIRVMFRDFAIFGNQDCEAMTMKTKSGTLVIYINQEHKSASPELIACLIAHESQHHTFTNSKAEELKAWVSETQTWNEIVKKNKAILNSNEPLAKRENYIAKVKNTSGILGIQKIIANNPVYAGLN